MKNFLFLSFFTSILFASSLTLEQIDERLQKSHPLFLSMQEQKKANNAKIKGEYASDSFVLSGSSAQANPSGADEEIEYSVGVSKKFLIGNQRSQKLQIAELDNHVLSLELKNKLLKFSNNLKSDYHQSCLVKEQRVIFEQSYKDFEKFYVKKQKAYEYKEISKKELLQLKIEKADLKQKLQSLKSQEHILKQTLFDAVGVESSTMELSCSDLHPMKFNQNDSSELFAISVEVLDKQILALEKSINLYGKNFESIEFSIDFDKEVDMQRYGIGVSIPLSFTSSSNEYKKISALHLKQALKLQKQNILIEKNRKFKQLYSELQSTKNLIVMIDERIAFFKSELLPLVEKSYQLGESSVMEYLLSKQKFWQLQESLSEHKKSYYKMLFTLYTVAQIKEI